MNEQEVRDLLNKFMRAWGLRDVDAILSLMTEDCVYQASVGPEPGATFNGALEVRAGLLEMFAHDSGSEAAISNIFVAGDRAAWEWRYFWPEADEKGEERGCDFFEFSEGKISRKNAFRKVLG